MSAAGCCYLRGNDKLHCCTKTKPWSNIIIINIRLFSEYWIELGLVMWSDQFSLHHLWSLGTARLWAWNVFPKAPDLFSFSSITTCAKQDKNYSTLCQMHGCLFVCVWRWDVVEVGWGGHRCHMVLDGHHRAHPPRAPCFCVWRLFGAPRTEPLCVFMCEL